MDRWPHVGRICFKPRSEQIIPAKMLTVNMPEAVLKTQRCLMSFTVVSFHAWQEIGVLVLSWASTIPQSMLHKHEAKVITHFS